MFPGSHSNFELVTSPLLYPFSSLPGLPDLLKSPLVGHGTSLETHLPTGTGHFPEMQEGTSPFLTVLALPLCFPYSAEPRHDFG